MEPPLPPDEIDLNSLIEEDQQDIQQDKQLEPEQEEPEEEEPEDESNELKNKQQEEIKLNLLKLNLNQLEAVTWKLQGGLQILAGPGSGKTKVLTSRIANLLLNQNQSGTKSNSKSEIKAEEILVVTFTNKAALEMKERLKLLIGDELVNKLVMGTFHSVCVRYLRKYGKLINLSSNFIIADRNDCLSIIKQSSTSNLKHSKHSKILKPNFISDLISKCKSLSISPQEYLNEEMRKPNSPESKECTKVLVEIFEEYERSLNAMNSLDFDDLLLYGLKLLTQFPHIISKIKTVLIDEFQDVNSTQYNLVKIMSKAGGSLCIVGDPDQGIYGWRNASTENLGRMLKDFKNTKQIFLEDNYRSTGSIIGAALSVIKEDTKRINKSMKPTHSTGHSVILHKAPTAPEEGNFIAAQIKMLVAYSGGLIDYSDIAILLRYGALSRVLEVALQKAGIPSRMVGGNKFFERLEVKDILSYLQLVDNPNFSAALIRMINVPKRGIGEKTIQSILATAKFNKVSGFEICVKVANGFGLLSGSVSLHQRKAIRDFVKVVRDLRAFAEQGNSVPSIIDHLVRMIDYNSHLERTNPTDYKERLENILELKAYASTVAEENPEGVVDEALDGGVGVGVVSDGDGGAGGAGGGEVGGGGMGGNEGDEENMENIVMSSQIEETTTNPLRTFLAVSMLATDTESTDDKSDIKKVTFTTCHSSKGLEWAVVFIPACEEGVYPFYRSNNNEDEIAEERRLLYVAITRAKFFCTISYSQTRMQGAETKKKELSSFLSKVSIRFPTLFVPLLQKITPKTRIEIAQVLGREKVMDEQAVAIRISEHLSAVANKGTNLQRYGSGSSSTGGSFNNNYNNKVSQPAPIPAGAATGFTSALKKYQSTPIVPLPVASSSTTSNSNSLLPVKQDQPTLSFGLPKINSLVSDNSSISTSGSTSTSAVLDSNNDPLPSTFTSTTAAADNSNPLPTKMQPFKRPTFIKKPPLQVVASSSSSSSSSQLPLPPPPPPSLPSTTTATTSLSSTLLQTSPKSTTTTTKAVVGSLKMPETRQSKIDEAILLNPIYVEPIDLLERFKAGEVENLRGIRGEAPVAGGSGGEMVVDEEVVEEVVEVVGRRSGRKVKPTERLIEKDHRRKRRKVVKEDEEEEY